MHQAFREWCRLPSYCFFFCAALGGPRLHYPLSTQNCLPGEGSAAAPETRGLETAPSVYLQDEVSDRKHRFCYSKCALRHRFFSLSPRLPLLHTHTWCWFESQSGYILGRGLRFFDAKEIVRRTLAVSRFISLMWFALWRTSRMRTMDD